MKLKIILALIILAAVAGAYMVLQGGNQIPGTDGLMASSSNIPEPYYLDGKKADIYNPDDVIRYGSSISNYATNLDIFKRAAFYEWYFRSHGFEGVTFAYSDNFRNEGKSHLWLLVRTPKGEVIEVEPSYREMSVNSMVPLNPEYTKYQKEFRDIQEACRCLGANKLNWWNDENAHQAMDENVLLSKKGDAMRKAAE